MQRNKTAIIPVYYNENHALISCISVPPHEAVGSCHCSIIHSKFLAQWKCAVLLIDLADHSDCSNNGTRDRIYSRTRNGIDIPYTVLGCAVRAMRGVELVCLQNSVACQCEQCKVNTEGRMPVFKLAC